MPTNKHLKDAAHSRAELRDVAYQRALREVVEELTWLHRHAPTIAVIWDAGIPLRAAIPDETARRTALGAVGLALRESRALDGVINVDHWRTLEGHIDYDWPDGPYANEVVRQLITFAENPETGTIEPGEFSAGFDHYGTMRSVWINRVRVRFRPYSPVGMKAHCRRMWQRIGLQAAEPDQLSR
jgi:hypothetical protein